MPLRRAPGRADGPGLRAVARGRDQRTSRSSKPRFLSRGVRLGVAISERRGRASLDSFREVFRVCIEPTMYGPVVCVEDAVPSLFVSGMPPVARLKVELDALVDGAQLPLSAAPTERAEGAGKSTFLEVLGRLESSTARGHRFVCHAPPIRRESGHDHRRSGRPTRTPARDWRRPLLRRARANRARGGGVALRRNRPPLPGHVQQRALCRARASPRNRSHAAPGRDAERPQPLSAPGHPRLRRAPDGAPREPNLDGDLHLHRDRSERGGPADGTRRDRAPGHSLFRLRLPR